MFNLGDDSELDRFSREAAGKYSPPGEPNWEKLSIELDKVLPVEEKKRRFVFFWWLLPVLLIGGAVTYWLESKNDKKQSVAVITDVKKSENNTSNNSSPGVIEKQTVSGVTGNHQTSKEINTTVISSTEKSVVPAPVSKKAEPSETVVSQTVMAKKKSAAVAGLQQKETQAESVKLVASSKPLVSVSNDASNTTVKNTQSTGTSNQSVTVTPEQNKIATNSNQEVLTTATTAESATETIIAKKEESIDTEPKKETIAPTIAQVSKNTDNSTNTAKKGRGFSYSFLAGFDKSTVKYRYDFDPGYNIGVMGGYHFNSKWSVHTGVIYTKKSYKMDGADFTAPKGTPASYYKLDMVDGYCKMWEVPVVARYTIPKARGNSFFLSAGLTSYFMTNEDYNYYYKYLGMPVVKNTSYNTGDSYLFSIVHLSAGFSKPISKAWDMQLEPYAKIPLGGVGFGSIELSSFGINFSLQHRQPLKK